jgi:hypothetical protein
MPRGIPVRVTNIFDHTLVIQVYEMYSHRTTPLYIYQFTALCTGCNRLHDIKNECNLQPTSIGIDLDMPASYSKHSIPLPTLSWGQPPLRHEPGNGGPVAARFARFDGEEAGYFLGRIQSYLAPNQYKWHISFKFQSCDKTREWTRDAPSHKVESLLETIMIILNSAPDRWASLKLRPTMLGSNNGIDASPPLASYMRELYESVIQGEGKIFPVYPNLHRFLDLNTLQWEFVTHVSVIISGNNFPLPIPLSQATWQQPLKIPQEFTEKDSQRLYVAIYCLIGF